MYSFINIHVYLIPRYKIIQLSENIQVDIYT